MKESKSKALESRLGNNIGYCPKCEKKHPKGKHEKKEKVNDEEEDNKKEINGDQED